MENEFLGFLLPNQRPGEWKPDEHIDLLPAFQQRYPCCMCDDLLAVQLFNPAGPTNIDWLLRVVRVGVEQIFKIAEEVHHYGDEYDYCDGTAEEFPYVLIRDYLKADRIDSLQAVMNLFKPSAFDMLCRIKADAQLSLENKLYREHEYIVAQHQERADFLREVAIELAAHLTHQVNLAEPVMRQFKSESSFGIREEESKSRWLEIGAEAYQPSLLYEIAKNDVESAAWQHFQELPASVQLAIWFSTVADAEMPGGDSLLQWDTPAGPRKTWKFWGLDDHFSDIASEVMSQAEDDYIKARESAQATDEDT